MADPISLASGLLALATFAFQCSVSLYETLDSFQSHPKRVRDLLEELAALGAVLGPLVDMVHSAADAKLASLELPLLRCGSACQEFQALLLRVSSRSTASRTSFRDWAQFNLHG